MEKKLPHFSELDGLRGVAATYVFFHHAAADMLRSHVMHSRLGWTTYYFFAFGAYSVDVFFVLSGFLITSLLLIDRENPAYFHDFYWKRILRIQPAFLVFLLTLSLVNHAPRIHEYMVFCLLFIANFQELFNVGVGSVAWTLCIEEQFYLCWPQVVRRLNINAIAYCAASLVLFSNLVRIFFAFRNPGFVNWVYTPFRLDGLAFGALAACGFIARDQLHTHTRSFLSALQGKWAIRISIAAILLLPISAGRHYSEPFTMATFTFATFQLISYIARGNSVSVLRWRGLLFMGSISYGFYLYHPFIISLVQGRLGTPKVEAPGYSAITILIEFLAAIAVSVLSLYLIEKPAQRLRRFVIRPLATPSPLQAVAE